MTDSKERLCYIFLLNYKKGLLDMLKQDVDYKVTVIFRDPFGCADETDPQIAIQDALKDIDLSVVDISFPKKVISKKLSSR